MEPKLAEVIQYGFYALMSLVTSYGVTRLSSLVKSVDTLNVEIAKVIEKSAWHEKELTKHDLRLSKLEQPKLP